MQPAAARSTGAKLLVALLLTVAAGPAAACGTPEAGAGFATSVRSRLRCEDQRARGLVSSCEDPAAVCPAQVDRVATLVFNGITGVPTTGIDAERRCQRALASLATKYVARRARELSLLGRRQAGAAARLLGRATARCDGVPIGNVIPTVGDACASLAAPFDAARTPACVRAALEAITQDAVGVHLRPNILMVLTDDQRRDTLEMMPTVLDRLAARGIAFTEAFASTSLCAPDRASILTGRYAHNHGVHTNGDALDFDHEGDTIARQLHDNAGYATALLGKYMNGTGEALGSAVPPGWDEWHVFASNSSPTYGLYYGYQLNTNGQLAWYGLDAADQPIAAEYSTDLLRDRALGLLDQWSARPFFVEYAPFAPHTPAIPAERHRGTFALLPPARPPNHLEADITDKPAWLAVYQFAFYFGGADPVGAADRRRVAQLETLLAVDDAVGAISDRLEALGLTDNTLVVFTSDNGFLWLEHWLTLKNYPYDESVRLPLIVRYPLLAPAARTSAALVSPIDFYPTFAELAGVPGAVVNGASLAELLANPAAPWRDVVLLEHFGPEAFVDDSIAVRTADWKLVETAAASGVTTELYDLAADPYELTNVAADPANAGIVTSLHARLSALAAE